MVWCGYRWNLNRPDRMSKQGAEQQQAEIGGRRLHGVFAECTSIEFKHALCFAFAVRLEAAHTIPAPGGADAGHGRVEHHARLLF